MTYDQTKVAFVDTETEGLDPGMHGIWEIAVIVDGEEHCWQQRLWPDPSPLSFFGLEFASTRAIFERQVEAGAIDQWVLDNTGLADRYDHATALDPGASIERFVELTRGRHLVGACPWFDSERLHRLVRGYLPSRDLPWHYHLIDVETLVVGATRMTTGDDMALPWSSDELSERAGVTPLPPEERHTALADARWAKAIFERVMGGPS